MQGQESLRPSESAVVSGTGRLRTFYPSGYALYPMKTLAFDTASSHGNKKSKNLAKIRHASALAESAGRRGKPTPGAVGRREDPSRGGLAGDCLPMSRCSTGTMKLWQICCQPLLSALAQASTEKRLLQQSCSLGLGLPQDGDVGVGVFPWRGSLAHAILRPGFLQQNNVGIVVSAQDSKALSLRISELLGLQWSDVDWLGKTLRIERGVVKQIVDDVKSSHSAKTMAIADELLEVLKLWRQVSQFSGEEDWIFASPTKLGRQPICYTYVWETLTDAAARAGIGHVSSHVFRHTHRSWLDSVGTPVGVQQRLMRHADIRTTMNIYGDAATDDMRHAHEKVVRLALTDRRMDRKAAN